MTASLSNHPKKVLILSLSGIGNFLMQSPTWQTLKKNHPDWEITAWIAPRGTKQLAKADSSIDNVIEAPINNSLFEHINTLQQLRRHHFDLGLVMSPGQQIKSAAYLYLAGIPQRVGHTYPFLNNSHSNFLLTNTIDENEELHDIEQNLQLLEMLGIKLQESSSRHHQHYYLRTPNHLPPHYVIWRDKNLIGLHPGSASHFPWKRWPLNNFVSIGQSLISEHNAHILIFGGPDEKDLKENLKKELGEHSTIITTDLLATAALMQHCQFVLSNDSGLMHLAAASGTITFGLFGPTDEKHTGPRGPNSFVIRAPGTKPIYDTEKNYDLGSKPHPTITAINPEQVLDKILRAVSQ